MMPNPDNDERIPYEVHFIGKLSDGKESFDYLKELCAEIGIGEHKLIPGSPPHIGWLSKKERVALSRRDDVIKASFADYKLNWRPV